MQVIALPTDGAAMRAMTYSHHAHARGRFGNAGIAAGL